MRRRVGIDRCLAALEGNAIPDACVIRVTCSCVIFNTTQKLTGREKTKQIEHHARSRQASATALLRTGADMC